MVDPDVCSNSTSRSGGLLRAELRAVPDGASRACRSPAAGWREAADCDRERRPEGARDVARCLAFAGSGGARAAICGCARELARSRRRRWNTTLCTQPLLHGQDVRTMARWS